MENSNAGVVTKQLPKRENYHFDLSTAKAFAVYQGREMSIKDIVENASDGARIILPQGVYFTDNIILSQKKDVRIFGYGVCLVFESYTKSAILLQNCEEVAITGLAIDHRYPANTQGDVLEAGENWILWQAHTGYVQNLLDDAWFHVSEQRSPPGEGYRKGSDRPFCDLGFSVVKAQDKEGLFYMECDGKQPLKKGDSVVFRGKAAHVNYFEGCSGIVYEDICIFSGSGFGVMEKNGTGGTKINRMLITPGQKPIGAHRDRLVSTCDATHSANMRKGPQVTNSLFEKMTDDAANIHSYFGSITSFSENEKRLAYTYGTESYKTVNAPFLKGDNLLIFTQSGEILAKGVALCATGQMETGEFFVEIDTVAPFVLKKGALLQNLSAAGNGFVYENCKIDNNRSRGILIKASGGTIRNCTFSQNGMSAILIKPEMNDGWGECGFVENIVIENNLVVENGFFTGSLLHSAIYIDGDTPDDFAEDTDICHKNIAIVNNVFLNRHTTFAIVAGRTYGLTIKRNYFGPRIKGNVELCPCDINPLAPEEDDSPVIFLSGAKSLVVSKNQWPSKTKIAIKE